MKEPIFTQQQVDYLSNIFKEELQDSTYHKLLQKQGNRQVIYKIQSLVDQHNKARVREVELYNNRSS